MRKRARAYRSANREEIRAKERGRRQAAYQGGDLRLRAMSLLNAARCRSKKRGLPCTLTAEWVLERLLAGRCEATGTEFEFDTRTRRAGHAYTSKAPSLDRVDPALGYTPENTQVVVAKHNAAKASSTTQQHINYCLAYLRHQGIINESMVEIDQRRSERSFKRCR